MSLQRKALTRRTELRRTPLQRNAPMNRARAVRTQVAKARKDTGPTKAQRDVVLDRSIGFCEICGSQLWVWPRGWVDPHSFHHRQPRQMGGTRRADINSPANLLLLCGTGTTGCHGHIESNRTEAYRNGWLVRASADPAEVPVLLEGSDRYLLAGDGTRTEITTPEED